MQPRLCHWGLTLAWAWLVSAPARAAMQVIPPGTFIMGARVTSGAPYAADELPPHAVTLGLCLMSDTEVTIAQFCEMLNQRPDWVTVAAATEDGASNACYGVVRYTGPGGEPLVWLTTSSQAITNSAGMWRPVPAAHSNHPMVNVTWYGAALFCNFLSARDGFVPLYHTVTWACDWTAADAISAGYHLPTEAQWERAACGDMLAEAFPWGRFMDYAQCNVYASGDPAESDDPAHWPATMPVGSFPSNGFGLYDVIGNVREWCHDWYASGYYATSPLTCPKGPDAPAGANDGGSNRVARGGGWTYAPRIVAVAAREGWAPVCGANDLGLRVSRFAVPVPEPAGALAALAALSIAIRRRRSHAL